MDPRATQYDDRACGTDERYRNASDDDRIDPGDPRTPIFERTSTSGGSVEACRINDGPRNALRDDRHELGWGYGARSLHHCSLVEAHDEPLLEREPSSCPWILDERTRRIEIQKDSRNFRIVVVSDLFSGSSRCWAPHAEYAYRIVGTIHEGRRPFVEGLQRLPTRPSVREVLTPLMHTEDRPETGSVREVGDLAVHADESLLRSVHSIECIVAELSGDIGRNSPLISGGRYSGCQQHSAAQCKRGYCGRERLRGFHHSYDPSRRAPGARDANGTSGTPMTTNPVTSRR